MEKSLYIDANIFIFAYGNDEKLGNTCRGIIDLIIKGRTIAFTSVLTFDEFFYQIKKLKGYEKALFASHLLLNLKNLNFINVDLEIISYSYSLLGKYKLEPRDAIHLACALSKDIKNIATNDKDFDKIPEIKRFDIKDFS